MCLQIFCTLDGTSLPLISFSKPTTNSFKDDMAPKYTVTQSSRKVTRPTSQGSTALSTTYDGVMTRSMAKAVASSAREQAAMAATSKSRKVQNGDSKITDGATQIAPDALKQISIIGFNMPRTFPSRMDELPTHTSLAF